MDKGKRAALAALIVAVACAGAWALSPRRAPEGPGVGSPSSGDRTEAISFTMGTVARIVAEGPGAEAAVAGALEELDRLSLLFDRFRPYGDVWALNAAGGEWVEVTPEVLELIEEAVRLAELSGGAFDPTIAPVIDLWGFVEVGAQPEEDGHEHSRAPGSAPTRMAGTEPPDPQELETVLKRVGYRRIEVDPDRGRARVGTGQTIDLGAIAKGYGVDRAAQLLKERGIVRGLVDLGGDIYALGTRADGSPWRLGIRHPRQDGALLGILRVSDAAVATSGDYERYFEHEGVRYSHIVDPRTGWPARELVSVTVVAPSGVWADALATAVFVLGKEEGLALLESLPGVEGIVVDAGLQVAMTSGLEGKLELLLTPAGESK